MCGATVLRRKWDLMHQNTQCQHRKQTRGIQDKRLMSIFRGMIQRCYNPTSPSYGTYGGKGIVICDEWLHCPQSFEAWALQNGYSETLTLDRKDEKRGYCPNNCRWISLEENSKYKSTTTLLDVDGVSRTGRDWAIVCDLGINTINAYLRRYPIEVVQAFIRRCIQEGKPRRGGRNSYLDVFLAEAECSYPPKINSCGET